LYKQQHHLTLGSSCNLQCLTTSHYELQYAKAQPIVIMEGPTHHYNPCTAVHVLSVGCKRHRSGQTCYPVELCIHGLLRFCKHKHNQQINMDLDFSL